MFWLRFGASKEDIIPVFNLDFDVRYWEYRDNIFINSESKEIVLKQDRFPMERLTGFVNYPISKEDWAS